jgi:hypothetical protein
MNKDDACARQRIKPLAELRVGWAIRGLGGGGGGLFDLLAHRGIAAG